MVENIEFDLTALGFNVQNTLVPSRTLYRVPTVLEIVKIQKKIVNKRGTLAKSLSLPSLSNPNQFTPSRLLPFAFNSYQNLQLFLTENKDQCNIYGACMCVSIWSVLWSLKPLQAKANPSLLLLFFVDQTFF